MKNALCLLISTVLFGIFAICAFSQDIPDSLIHAGDTSKYVPGDRSGDSFGPIPFSYFSSQDMVMGPAPDAAKMTKYADTPVSYAYGLAQIGIPIYTIESLSLHLPITLSYDCSGIKADEISGIAGLGWSLHSGGVITREIISRDDDSSYNEIPAEFTDPEGFNALVSYVMDGANTDYDRYYYSFCGHSGSFYILPDASGVYQIIPTEPTELIISRLGNGFSIVDPEGTRYLFTLPETSSRFYGSNDPNAPMVSSLNSYDVNTITSWHLTEIHSMDGTDSITISYRQAPQFSHISHSYYRSITFPYKYLGQDTYQTNFTGTFNNPVTIQPRQWSTTATSTWRPYIPDSISFNGGVVILDYTTLENTSLLGSNNTYPVFLKSITLQNALGQSVRSWSFSNTMTTERRTLLTSVTEKGTDGSVVEQWNMVYNNPNVNIKETYVDLFGYYNGSTQSSKAFLRPFNDTYTVNFSEGNRNYNFTCEQYRTLTSITTASGSKTCYVYEPNSIPTNGLSNLFPESIKIGQRIASISTYDLSGGTEKLIRKRTFTYNSPDITIPIYGFQSGAFITTSEYNTFDDNTHYGYWYGLYSPLRIGTIVYSDQSCLPGLPLESARIFYTDVEETLTEGSSTYPLTSTRWEYSSSGAISYIGGGPAWSPSDTHDNQYTPPSTYINHFSQRFPAQVQGNVSMSNSFVPLGYHYTDQNRPQLSNPIRVTIKKRNINGTLSFLSQTDFTYETKDTLVQTGLFASCKRSVNTNEWLEDPNYCLEDFDQQPVSFRIIYMRLKSRQDKEYLDYGTIKSSLTQYAYDYSLNGRTSLHSGNSYLSNVIHIPRIGAILAPRREIISYSDSPNKLYLHSLVYPDELTGVPGCSWASQLKSLGYRSPVGEEIGVGAYGLNMITREGRYTIWDNVPISSWSGANNTATVLKPIRTEIYRDGINTGPTISYSKYDTLGRPLEIKADGKPDRTYVWGYHHKYPVAEIAGLGLEAVKASLSANQKSRLDAIANEQTLALPQLDSLLRYPLSNVMISTQSYQPLVGIKVQEDPSGRKISYSYDAAGRLYTVTNDKGSLVQRFEYDYARGASGSPNYFKTTTYTTVSANNYSALKEVSFFDGLGRNIQNISVGAATGNRDLVTSNVPDILDHEDNCVYLPYPATTTSSTAGQYRSDAVSAQQTYYGSGVRAYSVNIYEPSSRNKKWITIPPGFSDATSFYTAGAAENTVLKLSYNASANSISANGYYASGMFTVAVTTRPDGSRTESYTDEFQTPVLERVKLDANDTYADTYYIKDPIGRVICVVPPAEAAQITSSTIGYSAVNCYTYAYDARDRIIKRQLPAQAEETLTYNEADQVLTRSRLAADGLATEVFTTNYDSFLRPISQTYKYGNNTSITLAEYFYDTYPYGAPSFSSVSGYVTSSDKDNRTMGLKTAERITALPASKTPSELTPANTSTKVFRSFYYDFKGNVVQLSEKNTPGGINRTSSKYGFANNLLKQRQTITTGSGQTAHTLTHIYTFDSRLRPITVTAQLDGGEQGTLSYSYDDLERVSVIAHGSSVDTTWYTYTLQGWLDSTSSASWFENLKYASPSLSQTNPLPGKVGLITEWSSKQNGTASDGGSQAETYSFTYDKARRLTGSSRYEGSSTTPVNTLTERDITYDNSGNLLTLNRFGASSGTSPVDSLVFSYTGPKRNGWSYDMHGNITTDPANGIDLAWNIAGLPRVVSDGNGSTLRTYLADGTLINVSDGDTTRFYLGNMVLKRPVNGSFSLESAGWDGGRFLAGAGVDKVLYSFTDHLGSVRVVKDGTGAVRQRFDYYPYGSVSNSWTSNNTSDHSEKRYRFSNKEIAGPVLSPLSSGSAPYLDFGARLYNPRTAHWLSQDPCAEDYYPLGPYTYCAGNPVNLIDSNGLWYWSPIGDLFWENGDNIFTLANFLEISEYDAFLILCRNADSSGKSFSEGYSISCDNIWTEPKVAGKTINNTISAVLHYYNPFNKGKPVIIGDQSTAEAISLINEKHPYILEEENGSGLINMKYKTFHIGWTPYSFMVEHKKNTRTVTYYLFKGDSFSDPNFVVERMNLPIKRLKADHEGPNLELGGTPYKYSTRVRTYYKPSPFPIVSK